MTAIQHLKANYYSPESLSDSSTQVYPQLKNSETVSLKDKYQEEQDRLKIEELKKRDREVREHEQAHINAGGNFIKGGASFSYRVGPDSKRYAVSGSVNIDTAAVPNNPEATIRKADVIRQAALAPANPSAQDIRVAAEASEMARQAQAELSKQRMNNLSFAYSSGTLHSSTFELIV